MLQDRSGVLNGHKPYYRQRPCSGQGHADNNDDREEVDSRQDARRRLEILSEADRKAHQEPQNRAESTEQSAACGFIETTD